MSQTSLSHHSPTATKHRTSALTRDLNSLRYLVVGVVLPLWAFAKVVAKSAMSFSVGISSYDPAMEFRNTIARSNNDFASIMGYFYLAIATLTSPIWFPVFVCVAGIAYLHFRLTKCIILRIADYLGVRDRVARLITRHLYYDTNTDTYGTFLEYVRSKITFLVSTRYSEERFGKGIRSVFMSIPLEEVPPPQSHTHGPAAATRTAQENFTDVFAATLKLNVYSVATSTKDGYKGILGSRVCYFQKDVDREVTLGPSLRPDTLIKMTDVDSHITDLPTTLAFHPYPTIISTVNPTRAAGNTLKQAWYFNSDGQLVTKVQGGSEYTHTIYDYSSDHIGVVGRAFGIPMAYVVYKVEKRQVDEFKCLVLLIPVRSWYGCATIFPLAFYAWEGKRPLSRFDPRVYRTRPVDGSIDTWICYDVHHNTGLRTTVAHANALTSCTVASELFDSALLYAAQTKHPLKSSMVSHIGASNIQGNDLVLFTFATLFTETNRPTLAAPEIKGVTFTTVGPTPEELPKVPLRTFMTPIITGAVAPIKDQANLSHGVKKRVTDLQANSTAIVTPTVTKYAYELAEYFYHIMDIAKRPLVPLTVDEVAATKTRPSQRANLLQASQLGEHALEDENTTQLTTMIKNEAASKLGPARIITICPAVIATPLACFVKAKHERLKQTTSLIAFMQPSDLANNLVRITGDATYVDVSDVSKMDGNTSAAVRHIEEQIAYKLWGPLYDEYATAFKHSRPRFVRAGKERFEPLFSQSSGSEDTTEKNCDRNIMLTFIAFRIYGYSMEETWDMLNYSMFGGDDNVTALPDVNLKAWKTARNTAATLLGYPLKISIVERGKPYQFLSRYWNTWDGSPDSMADVKRQLYKLHLTTQKDMTISSVTLAVQKANSILTSDKNTPYLGLWAKAVVEKYGDQDGQLDPQSWWSNQPTVFPNEPADWMAEITNANLGDSFNREAFYTRIATDPLEGPPAQYNPVSNPDNIIAIDAITGEPVPIEAMDPNATTANTNTVNPTSAAAPQHATDNSANGRGNTPRDSVQTQRSGPQPARVPGGGQRGRGNGHAAGSRRPEPPDTTTNATAPTNRGRGRGRGNAGRGRGSSRNTSNPRDSVSRDGPRPSSASPVVLNTTSP